ncbi:tetratricopeptide repeat protein [Sandaracinus amylolyticus]|nr:tetratricopeptide repeat protein [Sandaracinus amylolyticus]
MLRVFASLLFVVALLAPSLTRAQAARELSPAEVEEARALFVAGSAAVESGRWADAVSSFERAYEITGAPSALYNLGLALRALGRHRDARDAFDRLLTAHTLDDAELRREVEQMRTEEAARVAVLELVGLDADARHAIRFDGRDVADDGARPLDVETDAGAHTLIAEREGFRPFVWEGELADGERRAVRALFEPVATASASDDTALHVVLVVSAIAAVAAGGAILGYVLYEDAQVRPLYDQRVEP